MESAGAHFQIGGLHHHAALGGPVVLQGEDQPLKGGDISLNGIDQDYTRSP
jgi:hypothetical protein